MANYAFENKLNSTNGWKWAKKYKNYAHGSAKLIARVNSAKA